MISKGKLKMSSRARKQPLGLQILIYGFAGPLADYGRFSFFMDSVG
jgi:hypothetical protein